MSKSIKFSNNNYLDATGVTYYRKTIDKTMRRILFGYTREATSIGSAVKLFTIELSEAYKTVNVLFHLSDTQANGFSAVCGLTVRRAASNSNVSISNFTYLSFYKNSENLTQNLFAKVISATKVEVYFIMQGSMSPNLGIISSAQQSVGYNGYGNVYEDMSTIVSGNELNSLKQSAIFPKSLI